MPRWSLSISKTRPLICKMKYTGSLCPTGCSTSSFPTWLFSTSSHKLTFPAFMCVTVILTGLPNTTNCTITSNQSQNHHFWLFPEYLKHITYHSSRHQQYWYYPFWKYSMRTIFLILHWWYHTCQLLAMFHRNVRLFG